MNNVPEQKTAQSDIQVMLFDFESASAKSLKSNLEIYGMGCTAIDHTVLAHKAPLCVF